MQGWIFHFSDFAKQLWNISKNYVPVYNIIGKKDDISEKWFWGDILQLLA